MLLSEASSLEKEFLVTLYPSSLSFVKYLKLLRVAKYSARGLSSVSLEITMFKFCEKL